MSLTLRTTLRITTERTLLRHDADAQDGSRLQTLSGREGVMNLTPAKTMETQGMVSNLWHD